jgi:hypothetical protein
MKVLTILPALLLISGCLGKDQGPQDPPGASKTRAEISSASHQLLSGPDLRLSSGRAVVRAGWGSGPTELGKVDEASRPGPMDLAVDPGGVIHVLDQVNRRVQRFSPEGKALAPVPIKGQTAEYIALANGRVWVLSYQRERAGYLLERVDDANHGERLPLAEGTELVTGLFAKGEDVWIEQEHSRLTRIFPVQSAGRVVMGRPNQGKPGHHVFASKDREGGVLIAGVIPGDTTYQIMKFKPDTGTSVSAIEGLVSDPSGRIFVAVALTNTAALAGQDWLDVSRAVVVYRPGSRPVTVELAAGQATDMNNYLATGPRGGLYQLHTTAEGVVIRRWQVPWMEVRP